MKYIQGKCERNLRNNANISETYAKEILGSSRREKVEDYLFDGNFLKI